MGRCLLGSAASVAIAAVALVGCTKPSGAGDAETMAAMAPADASASPAPVPAAAAVEPADAGLERRDPAGMIRIGYSLGDARMSDADETRALDVACGAYRVQQATRAAPLRVLPSADGGRAGGPAFTAALPPGPSATRSLRALWCFDVTEDGAPELAYEEYTGGAHCCRVERVVSLGTRVTPILAWEAGDGYLDDVEKLDGQPGWELVGSDLRLMEWDSPATALPLPIVFALRDGRYRRATRDYPDLVMAHRVRMLDGDFGSAWGRALYRAGSGVLLGDWVLMQDGAYAELDREIPDRAALAARRRELDAVYAKLARSL